MSKGPSRLFDGTLGTRPTSVTTRELAGLVVRDLVAHTPGSKKKAMAVGAYDESTGAIAATFAGEIPAVIHPELLERAKAIGGLGTTGLTDRNIVGVCAEFHAVNNLLLGGAKWENIRLTPAIRPRTGKVIPYCDNCKSMFHGMFD